MRTRPCNPATISGRREKARQFVVAAETLELDDLLGDAYVTNCVHAGIAAADVICCVRLGRHALGQDHQDAIRLLEDAGPNGRDLARHLRVLLSMKTSAGYDATPIGLDDRRRAGRSMRALIDEMSALP